MKRLLSFAAIVCLCLMSSAPVSAASGEQILDFRTDVTLTKQNVADVQETIVYDFGTNQRHGIYRDIPVQYHDGSDTYYTSLDYKQTTDESGRTVQAELSDEGDNTRVRLGDPDVTISGVHTYTISYTLSPIVYLNEGKPFLNFDVIGTGFDVPIRKASAMISIATGSTFSNAMCFKGSFGSQESCMAVAEAPTILRVDVVDLAANQGVTINTNLPDGYMDSYLQPNQKPPITAADIWAAVAAAIIPILIFGGLFAAFAIAGLRSLKAKRRRANQTVVAQYDPPDTLTPAEIGHLSDDSSDTAEITATVIDLARRGFIKVQELPAPGGFAKFFGKRQDYKLLKLQEPTGLNGAESALFNGLFGDKAEVQLSKLDRTKTAAAVTSFKSSVKDTLRNKGYYAAEGGPLTKGVLTDEGAKEWALVDGFKLFITVVEKDRLAFTDAPDKTPERFNALLPYAIALGVEKQWAKQFKDINVQQQTDWYTGNNMAAFSAVSLANSLNSGFATTLATNSSISSGGGSVGGGGGGGGGGSW